MIVCRRHLARKHSTNYKCAKEGCDKTFAKQYQVNYNGKVVAKYMEFNLSVWRAHETPHAPLVSHVREAVQEEAERRHPPDGRARVDQGWSGNAWPVIGEMVILGPWVTNASYLKCIWSVNQKMIAMQQTQSHKASQLLSSCVHNIITLLCCVLN